jgi:hypothetical protein
MSSTITTRLDEQQDPDSAGVARSEPGGRAQVCLARTLRSEV